MYVGLLKKNFPLLTILNTNVPNPGPAPVSDPSFEATEEQGFVKFPNAEL